MFPSWLVKLVGQHALLVSGPGGRETKKVINLRLKARVVCSTCNNGWMSRIEERVKPVLGPMLTGHAAALDSAAQVALARWAIKTSMVMEYALERAEESVYWTAEERSGFAATPHKRPGDARVLIGTYFGRAMEGAS